MPGDYELEKFRQQLRTRPGRRRLGVHLDQAAVLRLLESEVALRIAYEKWRRHEGLPEAVWATGTTEDLKPPRLSTAWERLTKRWRSAAS